MTRRGLFLTLIIQIVCWSVVVWVSIIDKGVVRADAAYQITTPEPFLGSIYYGREDIWQVFDHRFPGGFDIENYLIHYDGTQHDPVTATPIPGATPTPEGTPPPEPYIPGGYGYTGHLGIDYSLQYEPVLAAASGTVQYAGWLNHANHRDSYGLYVILDHTPATNYETWYGHLSALTVKTNESIVIDPNDPGNRNRILGISGNTGAVFNSFGIDCGSILSVGPTCGQHLHFEVRTADTVVNPYGWIAPVGTSDPWAIHQSGETSYDLWATRPAVESYTDQYPGGTPLTEPSTNDYLIEVDNSTSFQFSFGGCWLFDWNNPAGIQGNYAYSSANIGPCEARWKFDPNALAPAGDYDVYAHIPDPATSLSAEYTIYHSGVYDTAIVVQAAYPNDNHDNWAYLGRYYFRMNGITEYVSLNNQNLTVMTEDTGNLLIADAIRLMPAEPRPDIEVPIAASTDDAGLNYLCSYSVAHNEIYLGHCSDGTNIVSGFRFQNVSVPQGAVISAARLEFTVDGSYTTNIDVLFRGERVADAAAFSNTSRPSDRSPLTTAAATWHVGSEDEWFSWHTRRSPDLSAIIQEIVNQPGWVSGNDLVIIV